jgi:hypothetical protein
VGNSIIENVVGENDLCVVQPSGAIWKDSDGKLFSLERLHCNIAERCREDYVVGNEVVLQDCLESLEVGRLEDGANVGECFVGGDEYGVVGYVESLVICFSLTEGKAKVRSFEGSAECSVACTVGEKLERSTERKDGVNLVNCNSFAQLDVLEWISVSTTILRTCIFIYLQPRSR